MKEIHIKVSNISERQWSSFLIELNLVRSSWRKFGPRIEIKAKNFEKIIKWGRRKPGAKELEHETHNNIITYDKLKRSGNKTPHARS